VLRLALAMALAQVGFHAFIASLPIALVEAGRPNAEIGAIMGVAAVIPMGAALLAGGLIDRHGPRFVFLVGTSAFFSAAALLATGVAAPDGPTPLLLVARVLQGIGLAFVLPSALSLVPLLVRGERLGLALGVVGTGANVSLAVSPPVSLLVLDEYSIRAVATVAAISVAAAAVMLWPLRPDRRAPDRAAESRLRAFRPAWRAAWLAPLLVSFLFVAHWGVVTGYLPQRAEASGADVGLFFTADALGVLLLRVPAGWLAGKLGTRPLILSGIVITLTSLLALLPPSTTPLLLLAGLGTGGGAALILPPITLELSNRSTDADRGSAFALFNVAFSGGIAVGSIGLAPFIGALGFEAAIALGIGACVAAIVVQLLDRPIPPLRLEPTAADPAP
jgi:DHA1 family solute carrier family 18 vesicular amine transporter 1/2